MKYCISCGSKNSDGARFCFNCGNQGFRGNNASGPGLNNSAGLMAGRNGLPKNPNAPQGLMRNAAAGNNSDNRANNTANTGAAGNADATVATTINQLRLGRWSRLTKSIGNHVNARNIPTFLANRAMPPSMYSGLKSTRSCGSTRNLSTK